MKREDTKGKILEKALELFAGMEGLSAIGYGMFPLSGSGYAATLQDRMHLIVTALVVL